MLNFVHTSRYCIQKEWR